MRVLLFVSLVLAGGWAMGVIETFSAVQSIPQEQIGAFNNDRGAKLLRDKNLERFGDKHIEIHEFPGEHGPFRVWLHDFKSYKAARKYIEHHAIDGFIIELKAGEHIRTKL